MPPPSPLSLLPSPLSVRDERLIPHTRTIWTQQAYQLCMDNRTVMGKVTSHPLSIKMMEWQQLMSWCMREGRQVKMERLLYHCQQLQLHTHSQYPNTAAHVTSVMQPNSRREAMPHAATSKAVA